VGLLVDIPPCSLSTTTPYLAPNGRGGFSGFRATTPPSPQERASGVVSLVPPTPPLYPEHEQATLRQHPAASLPWQRRPLPLHFASLPTPLPRLNVTGAVYFSFSRCPSPSSVRQRHPSLALSARRRFLVHPTPTLASNTGGGSVFFHAAKATTTPPSNSVPLCLRHIPLRRTSPLTASTPLAAAWRPGRPVARQRARPPLAHNHTPSPTTARAPSTIQHTKKYHKRWSKSRTSQPQRIKSAAAALTPQ